MLTKAQVKEIKNEAARDEDSLPVVFSALSDIGRYRIFKLLTRQTGLCVTEVAKIFNISVPAASQQLKIMEMSGLVRRTRSGQMICYTIRRENLVVKTIIKLIERESKKP